MRLVQLINNKNRTVAVVEGATLALLKPAAPLSIYELALQAIDKESSLRAVVEQNLGHEELDYQSVYDGLSDWKILPSFDHPADPARCTVSGTGLTHKASAENRSAMHKRSAAEVTDSIRMYQLGLEGGNPPPGTIGVQPEWFFKGNGFVLRGHNDDLEIPSYALDGGEEPEIAGAYMIASNGQVFRVGLTMANEFSDHQMEKKNYLYLAPSKLRNCSIGPELSIGDVAFEDIPGTVSIVRNEATIWQKDIWTGQKNMSYSVQNLEHHHFKYATHRRPGDVHIHFFGADAFSFGDGLALENGDTMEVSFRHFGRALKNRLRIAPRGEALVAVGIL